jgi:hypothetical protein
MKKNKLIPFFSTGIIIFGFYFYFSLKGHVFKSSLMEKNSEHNHRLQNNSPLLSQKISQKLEERRGDKKLANDEILPEFNDIIDIVKYYKKEELVLLRDSSRLGLETKNVRIFIEKARKVNNREDLIRLMNEVGKGNILLKMELAKFTNTKFPKPQKLQKKQHSYNKKFETNDILVNLKKR